MRQDKQEWMSRLLLIGFLLLGLGGFLTVALGLMGTAQFLGRGESPLMLAFGIALAVTALGALLVGIVTGYGLWQHRNRFRAPMQTFPYVYVVARYAIDIHTGETVPYWYDYAPENLRYYVRLDHGRGVQEEYECALETFEQVGEGMWGEAICQGQWLCAFRPHLGGAQSEV
jgi:hypothetical protein